MPTFNLLYAQSRRNYTRQEREDLRHALNERDLSDATTEELESILSELDYQRVGLLRDRHRIQPTIRTNAHWDPESRSPSFYFFYGIFADPRFLTWAIDRNIEPSFTRVELNYAGIKWYGLQPVVVEMGARYHTVQGQLWRLPRGQAKDNMVRKIRFFMAYISEDRFVERWVELWHPSGQLIKVRCFYFQGQDLSVLEHAPFVPSDGV
ncbi:hypothetical protein BT63DRAFT_90777 [Microthyrium microscopicum]|uniref:Uncharacterized protein n=1 Tax=Microthyrium microscopicum TaxID=703497 RepID=A0A6A6TWR2_9PEZI|nr:hypothetical protein BT63DRAFT_90777 [Microthyrium microscopicum]